MVFEQSEVLDEFFKLAEKQDMLKIAASKDSKNKTIEEKRLPAPEKNIMEVAHPEPVYIAESQGDGGLVENNIEQHNKLIEIMNKMPTGSLVHRYASAANELISLANKCDEAGQSDTADFLTETAEKLIDLATKLPFDKAPVKN